MSGNEPIWSRGPAPLRTVPRHGRRYGRYRWTVVLESTTTVEIDCDDVEFTPSGAVVFYGTFARDDQDGDVPPRRPTIAFAAGQWRYAYASSTTNPAPLAVEYWPGYV
jgi:hypothetical protein